MHIVLIMALLVIQFSRHEQENAALEKLGGMGGGGEKTKEFILDFGAAEEAVQLSEDETTLFAQFTIVNLRITGERTSENATPVIKNEKTKLTKKNSGKPSRPAYIPLRRIRGSGAGSGGGFGGGSGGGIGAGQGFSIDWGGTGSRRLLSGRLPKYPEDSDQSMIVTLEFTVMPDGSVSKIVPVSRSDKALEREAVAALIQWRFDPLPELMGEKFQTGRISFNFKLEN
jgi:TonB family protein